MVRFLAVTIFIFFSSTSLAQSVHGVFNVVKGEVKVKSARDGKVQVARVGARVFPKDTVITGKDARAKIVMVDKNVINVSPESEIVFENYEYKPSENKKNVTLNVIYGKVRSKVEQKYDGKTSQFQVKTPSAVAGVRGTDFLASYSSSSRATNVVTFEGKVDFGLPGPNGAILNPVSVGVGQMAQNVFGAPPSAPMPVPQESLASLDTDSNADTSTKAPADAGPDPRSPANEDGKKEEGPAGSSEDSAPAAKEKAPGASDKKEENKGNSGSASSNSRSGSSTGAGSGEGGAEGSAGPGTAAKGPPPKAAPAARSSGSAATVPPTAAAPPRAPSSAMPSGSGMMLTEDISVSPAIVPIGMPSVPTIPTFQAPTDILNSCTFCNQIIQDGNNRLIIKIQNQ